MKRNVQIVTESIPQRLRDLSENLSEKDAKKLLKGIFKTKKKGEK